MATKNNRIKNKNNFLHFRWRRNQFEGDPHKRGVVLRLRIVTPKKPNSARRPVAKVMLSNRIPVRSHIPGVGHNLRRFSKVLVFGQGPRDLPGVHFTCVRGKHDFVGLYSKKKRRSVYGAQRPLDKKFHTRRRYRYSFYIPPKTHVFGKNELFSEFSDYYDFLKKIKKRV